jgi:hypothetical protein
MIMKNAGQFRSIHKSFWPRVHEGLVLATCLAACLAPSAAWAQTLPSEPARLPSLAPQRIPSTIVGLSPEASCTPADSSQVTIELRDLRFSQVQTRQLRQQAIPPNSPLHAQLLQAARQHLQVPASAPPSAALSPSQTLCQLQELGAALSATYRGISGLAAPIFVIDPQEVVDGVLHMQVLEAELEALAAVMLSKQALITSSGVGVVIAPVILML